eukprot:gb/GEZN01008040.1/.p1 GENE.gb/GEZN01008040.1/~~gb/GEZN01008040.1/.p1  ORF type:complete len:433 (-),score=62.56 gb/GEZN01008040.1/:159-1457(-)
MAANLFIISESGEILIEKHWNNVVKKGRTVCDLYMEHFAKAQQNKSHLPPVIETTKFMIVHVTRFKLTFVSAVNKETSPLMMIEFLNAVIKVLLSYFGKDSKTLTALTIRENFSTIYQLLMEMADGGFPYNTDPCALKIAIAPPSVSKKLMETISGTLITGKDTQLEAKYRGSPIPWRAAKVDHVMNEVYVDVIEKIECVYSAGGVLLKSNVLGELRVSCSLSGTPDLTLRFNKPSLLDDCALHRSARIKVFQRDHVLSFIPPDGKFTLLTYRIGGTCRVPLYCKPEITLPRKANQTAQVKISLGTKWQSGAGGDDKPITQVVVVIPIPEETVSHTLKANCGEIKQDPKTKVVRWNIGRFPSDKNPELDGALTFLGDMLPDEQPVVSLEFYCKDHSATGLKVEALDIRNVPYKPFKGVRYATKAGRFQYRTG